MRFELEFAYVLPAHVGLHLLRRHRDKTGCGMYMDTHRERDRERARQRQRPKKRDTERDRERDTQRARTSVPGRHGAGWRLAGPRGAQGMAHQCFGAA